MPRWKVIGGADKGGILVRQGQDLKSPQEEARLSTGAIVEEKTLVSDRLQYEIVSGTGPPTGWVSVRISGKELLVPADGEEASGTAPVSSGVTSNGAGTSVVPWKELHAKVLSGAPVTSTLKANGSPWLSPVGSKREAAKLRLVLFTWTGNRGGAGSSHNFLQWPKILQEMCPDTFEVCGVNYPGRGSRMKEPCVEEAGVIAAAVSATLGKCGTVPVLLFGFSFGAILAYETAVLLEAAGIPVSGLVVASAEHPSWPDRRKGIDVEGKPTSGASDAQFEKVLKEKGGTDAILNNPDMKKMYLPVIRADMVMEEAYGQSPPAHPKLSCPIVAFRGKSCPIVPKTEVLPWLELTSCGDGTPTRIEEIEAKLTPDQGGPWLCDWYLCQGQASVTAMVTSIARDFGGAK
mmetsp:Transcript_8651/g.15556  ORF Transcript_8651/g.15556 Transcript_8651/m.15556 type:complete len:405 (+) Transcript_8651:53-1267(+)